MRLKILGTLLKVNEDAVRDRTELVINVRTTKLEKLGVDAKSFVGKRGAITVLFED